MSEGEFKKRSVHEAYINVEDIIQKLCKDEEGNTFLSVELPDEKYFVQIRALFEWLDEARKDFPIEYHSLDWTAEVMKIDENKAIKWFLKWFGGESK